MTFFWFFLIFGRSDFVAADIEIKSLRDIRLPAPLIAEIEEEYYSHFKASNPKDERTRDRILAFIPRRGIEFTVSLTSLKGKALRQPVQKRLPALGGGIELSRILREDIGTFLVKWSLPEDFLEGSRYKVFFVPLYQKLPDEEGIECGQYFDLTSYFQSELKPNGLEVTTAKAGYVPVLAGVFVFFKPVLESVELGVVEFVDERLSHRKCQTTLKGSA